MTPAQIIFANHQAIIMADNSYPYKLPRLAKPQDESLEKVWYCEYYVYDQTNQCLKRKRIVIANPTRAERLKSYKEAADMITKLLKAGAVVNPKKAEKKELDNQITTIAAGIYFINFSQSTIKQSTINSYKTQLNRLTQYLTINNLKDSKLTDITADIAQNFADWLTVTKKIGNRTRNNNINALISVFNFFKTRSIIDHNPFNKISQLRTVARSHTAFLPAQVQAFKKHCAADPQLWLFCQFIYFAFLRPRQELRYLKISDISEKSIVINFKRAKNGRTEHIMIPTALETLITAEKLRDYPPHYYIFGKEGHPSDTPTYYHQLYRRHATILIKCKLDNKNIDMYSWKHTGTINLWNATQNIQLIRQQCRHSDLGSTMKYLRDLGLFTDYDQINKFPEI